MSVDVAMVIVTVPTAVLVVGRLLGFKISSTGSVPVDVVGVVDVGALAKLKGVDVPVDVVVVEVEREENGVDGVGVEVAK